MLKKSGSSTLQVLNSGANHQFEQTVRLMGIREPIKRVNP
jgi:hypothetical protein